MSRTSSPLHETNDLRLSGSIFRALTGVTLSVLLLASSAHAGGPLMLSGHDPDDHGFVTQYTPLFNAIRANVTNGGSGILSIGADVGNDAGNWITAIAAAMTPPQTVTFINGATISTQPFGAFAMIFVPSTDVDTPGGIGTGGSPSENTRLISRAADIATFVNAGGGLFGLTQDQVANAYGYLGSFANITATGVPASGDCDGGAGSALYDDVTATVLGGTLGITNTNIDGCCWHNVFANFAPFLNVLATANEPACTIAINTEASVIGCLQCNIPGQMNLTPTPDLNPPNTNHTVTATFLQGVSPFNPIVGATITFNVISGPNVGATGNDVTDINGEATFTYTGTGGIGLDVIQASGTDTGPNPDVFVTSNDALKFWDEDCNANLIPDTCDLDCSAYGSACLANYPGCGTEDDLNAPPNGIPDSCDDCVTNADCSNGQFCDGSEVCNVDVCQPGSPPNCSDGVACTVDSCNEDTDSCDHGPNDAACDNEQFCDGSEICHLTLGCQDGPNPNCDDGITCTVDSCNEGSDMCDHAPNNATCSNGQFCDGTETCNVMTGCQPGMPPACGDGVMCTTDTCNEVTDSCDHAPNNGACNNGEFCDGNEICHVTLGCQDGADPNCNDGVGCTIDACVEVDDSCSHIPDDGSCADPLFCNGDEVCNVSTDCGPALVEACPGPPVCDESNDACVNCLTNADCNNLQFCDGVETCVATVCQPGTAPNCSDSVACTIDTCVESNDTCAHTPDDSVCSNADFCTQAGICDPEDDCQPGSATNCSDGVACTVDTCDEANNECDHVANDASCADPQFCNGTEVCVDQGMGQGCAPGTAVVCADSDGFTCTQEACDEATDECEISANQCVCGNSVREPGEECDPPSSTEDCNNMGDDDGDTDVDCLDIDCVAQGGGGVETCGGDCVLDDACRVVQDDPATITWGRDGEPDRFVVHGRFVMESPIEPLSEGFGVRLSNAFGTVYLGELGSGDMRGKLGGKSFKYRDKTARVDGVGARAGLYRVGVKVRPYEGVVYMTFKLTAYGDFSAATEAEMTTEVVVGSNVGYLDAVWTETKRGWKLPLSDFE